MMFNTTFNNISVISCRSVLLEYPEKNLPQVTDKLYHMTLNCTEKSKKSFCSNCFQGFPLSRSCLYCYHCLPFALHEPVTRKAWSDLWLNNTQNHTYVLPSLNSLWKQACYVSSYDHHVIWHILYWISLAVFWNVVHNFNPKQDELKC
jgi:hypothetical protein